MSEGFTNPTLQQLAQQYEQSGLSSGVLRNGSMIPVGASFINETTIFRDFGPVSGRAFKLSYNASPPLGTSWISRNTLDIDSRYYQRLAANGVLAFRFKGLKSWGRDPDYIYYGGNEEMRGYEYLQFMGNHGFFANAELRFPLIDAMLTPLGVLGGLRGVFFANLGASGYNRQPFKIATTASELITPLVGYDIDLQGNLTPRYGTPYVLSGLRLVDGRASYGFGLESTLLGFPMHFDWSWKTLFSNDWEDTQFTACAQTSLTNVDCIPAGAAFRKMKFDFWIGYDF
jgi:outer membrane protein assembly factor BamA